jgi:hypothetical protein
VSSSGENIRAVMKCDFTAGSGIQFGLAQSPEPMASMIFINLLA